MYWLQKCFKNTVDIKTIKLFLNTNSMPSSWFKLELKRKKLQFIYLQYIDSNIIYLNQWDYSLYSHSIKMCHDYAQRFVIWSSCVHRNKPLYTRGAKAKCEYGIKLSSHWMVNVRSFTRNLWYTSINIGVCSEFYQCAPFSMLLLLYSECDGNYILCKQRDVFALGGNIGK